MGHLKRNETPATENHLNDQTEEESQIQLDNIKNGSSLNY
jgi:hypothetical protein